MSMCMDYLQDAEKMDITYTYTYIYIALPIQSYICGCCLRCFIFYTDVFACQEDVYETTLSTLIEKGMVSPNYKLGTLSRTLLVTTIPMTIAMLFEMVMTSRTRPIEVTITVIIVTIILRVVILRAARLLITCNISYIWPQEPQALHQGPLTPIILDAIIFGCVILAPQCCCSRYDIESCIL